MKYLERLNYINSIDININKNIPKEDNLQAKNKNILKSLLPASSKVLEKAKLLLKNVNMSDEQKVLSIHEQLLEARCMYYSLSTILITSSLYYVGKNTENDKIWNDHWELIPEIAAILGYMLDDVFNLNYNFLDNDPFEELRSETIQRINVMKLLTWGLNTGVYYEHEDRLKGYETKHWGEIMSDKERAILWSTGWKKSTEVMEKKTLIQLMLEETEESKKLKDLFRPKILNNLRKL
jgi:hypothetical protein